MSELERCRPWIEAALEYSGGTHTFDDIVDGLRSARMQLWPAPRGCAVTEIVVYPRKQVLHVFLVGGELDQIMSDIDTLAAWGKAQGCESMTMAGRAGWARVLRPVGWEQRMIIMERAI